MRLPDQIISFSQAKALVIWYWLNHNSYFERVQKVWWDTTPFIRQSMNWNWFDTADLKNTYPAYTVAELWEIIWDLTRFQSEHLSGEYRLPEKKWEMRCRYADGWDAVYETEIDARYWLIQRLISDSAWTEWSWLYGAVNRNRTAEMRYS
jgi:hypothetical protein